MNKSHVWLSAVIFSLFAVMESASAQGRDVPECLNEQITKTSLLAELGLPRTADPTSPPPGTLEMLGPFNDPLYQGNEWEKRSWGTISRRTIPNSFPPQVQRTVVKMHFMWNKVTRQASQIKFKTTAEQGCVGTTVVAELLDGDGSGADPTNTLVQGYTAVNDGTTYFRILFPNVEAGPVTSIEESSMYIIGNCWRNPDLCNNTVPVLVTPPQQ